MPDEPNTPLTPEDVKELFDLIDFLMKNEGLTFDEIMRRSNTPIEEEEEEDSGEDINISDDE